MDGGVDASRGVRGGDGSCGILHLGCIRQWRWLASNHGHVGETATASLVERRGEGVDRRAAHQEPSLAR